MTHYLFVNRISFVFLRTNETSFNDIRASYDSTFNFILFFSFNPRVRDKIAPFLFYYSLSGPLKKKNRSNPIEDEYVHEGEC